MVWKTQDNFQYRHMQIIVRNNQMHRQRRRNAYFNSRKKVCRLSSVLVTSVMLCERREQMLSINRIVSVKMWG